MLKNQLSDTFYASKKVISRESYFVEQFWKMKPRPLGSILAIRPRVIGYQIKLCKLFKIV